MISYDAETGSIIYRSKMCVGLGMKFQVMPGAEWLELFCKHIPNQGKDRKYNPAANTLRRAEALEAGAKEVPQLRITGLMFMLASPSPGEDSDPRGFRAGLAVTH